MRTQVNQLQQHIDDLESPDASTREAASRAIHDLGDAARLAAPALFRTLLRETDACPSVGTALTVIGPLAPEFDLLESALQSDNSHVRFWAARTVVKLGPNGQPLIATLISRLCDPNVTVTDSVVWALGAIGLPAVSPLIDASRDSDPKLRARAVLALGCYPQDAALKLPAIVRSLDDTDANVRNHAARALCSLGQSAHSDRTCFDTDTFALLVAAIDRIADDASIEIDADWLGRIRRWLRPSAS